MGTGEYTIIPSVVLVDATPEIKRLKEQVAALEAAAREARKHLVLIEHKIDQHLQGQYNPPPYPALGTALTESRSAITHLDRVMGGK